MTYWLQEFSNPDIEYEDDNTSYSVDDHLRLQHDSIGHDGQMHRFRECAGCRKAIWDEHRVQGKLDIYQSITFLLEFDPYAPPVCSSLTAGSSSMCSSELPSPTVSGIALTSKLVPPGMEPEVHIQTQRKRSAKDRQKSNCRHSKYIFQKVAARHNESQCEFKYPIDLDLIHTLSPASSFHHIYPDPPSSILSLPSPATPATRSKSGIRNAHRSLASRQIRAERHLIKTLPLGLNAVASNTSKPLFSV